MSTLAAVRCPPRWFHVPEHVATYGPEVADLWVSAGQELDPEQRLVLDAEFAVDEAGRLVATELGCSAPRQNVKTHVGKAAALADLVLFRMPQCLWTAHLRQTSYDAFRNPDGNGLADLFDSYDHLRRMVYEIKDSDGGDRSITLRPLKAGDPKPTLEFVTRSDRGGRGLSGMRVTFDEALFLKASMTSAMLPILSARSMSGQVQARYLGSPGVLSSQTWREIRDKGRPGTARSLAWIEWAAERAACESAQCTHRAGEAVGCVLDREDLIREANLAIDRRIDIRFVTITERDRLTPVDFMRERMGWWEDPVGGGGVLDLIEWAKLAVGSMPMHEPVLSVEVALDRSVSTLGAAWSVKGCPHIEVVEDRPGTGWVVARVAEVAKRYKGRLVVLDTNTEAAGLIPGIEAAGVKVLQVKSVERVAACGAFYDAASTGRLTHNGDPAISDAIGAARWKDVGEGARVFSRRRSAGDIAALYAVVLALHGLAGRNGVDSGYFSMRDFKGAQ